MANPYKKAIDVLREGSFNSDRLVWELVKCHPQIFINMVNATRTVNLDSVKALIAKGEKIQAIKEHRNLTGSTLKDAKEAVEAMMEK